MGQKVIRAIGMGILVVMTLFPPWKASYTAGPEYAPGEENLGYRPVWFRLEQAPDDSRANLRQQVNIVRLGLQLGVVLLLVNVGLLATKKHL